MAAGILTLIKGGGRIIEEYLEGINANKYWGTLDISESTDSWKYLPNPIRVLDRD